jgi:hypothetical protein
MSAASARDLTGSCSMENSDGQPLRHGYTNLTIAHGGLVTKTFQGGNAADRQERESIALRELSGLLPVAAIVDSTPGALRTQRVAGRHGQDLIDLGMGHAVMLSLGRLLCDVQAIVPSFYPEYQGRSVLVHGDFGPNNVLLAEGGEDIVLLADWEWSTVGSPLTDLAWAEFIVRMHHPKHLDCLPALFEGYGTRPAWDERQAAMAERATALEDWVRSWKGTAAGSTWRRRSQAIAGWHELE